MELIVALLVLILSAIVTIWSLMIGWGLEPQSWPVIIGAIFLQFMLTAIITGISGKK